jgi:precorrin-6B methylase 2
MTRSELELISVIAADVPDHGVIVEVGSFAGRSSVHWAANSRPTVAIYCIDPFDAIVDDFSFEHMHGDPSGVRGHASGELFATYTQAWAQRLTAVEEASPPRSWSQSADVIFIDGDHTAEGVRRDLDFWIDHLDPGGRLLARIVQ